MRSRNVPSAEGWSELLLPEIERQRRLGQEAVFRAKVAFAEPKLYDALEERDVKYAIRLPASDILEPDIAELSSRPVGRPPRASGPEQELSLSVGAFEDGPAVAATVEYHLGELFPRVGFVTNLAASSHAVVGFYNKRGTAESGSRNAGRR